MISFSRVQASKRDQVFDPGPRPITKCIGVSDELMNDFPLLSYPQGRDPPPDLPGYSNSRVPQKHKCTPPPTATLSTEHLSSPHNMLAAAVGVDRVVEGDVRRLVATEDGLGVLLDHLRGRRQMLLGGLLIERAPAVIVLLPLTLLEPVRHRGGGAPALE